MKLVHFITLASLLISSSPIYANECAYTPAPSPENPKPELSSQKICGKLLNIDTLQLNKELLNNLYFSGKEFTTIRFDNIIFYVSKNGTTARVHYFDNGADYFVEGLARTIKNKKFGFIDEQLNIIIKPSYDFAFPFKDGTAVVCNDCQPESSTAHTLIGGGKWGKINKDGQVIIPLEHNKNEIIKKSH